jgi:tetratricopeptide (TPR) repeat protein
MEVVRFIFWTGLRTLGLIFLGLVAAKAVTGLRVPAASNQRRRFRAVRGALYTLILFLVVLGARDVGIDVAAQNYAWTSGENLAQGQLAKAYANALRAVELRPGELRYWQMLARVKLALRQFASVVADMPAIQALSGGKLDEDDAYRLAVSYYSLAQYERAIPLTQQMIRENRMFAAAYVLQGYCYMAQKRFTEAQRTFLDVLQLFPTQQAAVEGLAHTHFVAGNTAAALDVLAQTDRFPFPPEARKRFAALKALYAQ